MGLKELERSIKRKSDLVLPLWLREFVRGYILRPFRNFFRLFKKSKNYGSRLNPTTYKFYSTDKEEIRKHIVESYGYVGDLLDLFINNKDLLVHKWHHYLPIYDRYFSSYRNKPVRFLEIGVSHGGSLQMWRKFLGEEAIIFGVDIDSKCIEFDGLHGQVRVGSQDDENFLLSVIEEMGGVDLILDDGSHDMHHVRKSLEILLPHLSDGGTYMIEDMYNAYWPMSNGGYGSERNIFTVMRHIIDDMHHWYHTRALKLPHISRHCRSIHIYDSVVVIEKGEILRSYHSRIV